MLRPVVARPERIWLLADLPNGTTTPDTFVAAFAHTRLRDVRERHVRGRLRKNLALYIDPGSGDATHMARQSGSDSMDEQV